MSVCNRVAWWGMVVAVRMDLMTRMFEFCLCRGSGDDYGTATSVRLDYGLAFGALGAETLDGVVDGLDGRATTGILTSSMQNVRRHSSQ